MVVIGVCLSIGLLGLSSLGYMVRQDVNVENEVEYAETHVIY
ncbi:hypothetical protein WOSG25_190070 [Weissella oryzae SG25]|uniref:Uncharacterized protein n=1 Tax=Weissella oryzae (strain DSM 25784 / JCM 18191 / LMG 30913 / SG25) TaxID=1329250 RepID=A0A069CWQ9_WEIOS|nr:hypothetical protein WOSG25_190070 [Weissella oryzae SG25]